MREPDQVITVTPRMRLRLLELHGELDPRRVHVVTNGYPEIEVDPALSGRRPGRFTITYVGSFQGSVRRRGDSLFTPAILIPALDRIPADMVSVRVVGPVSEEQRRTVVGLDTRGIVELVGSVGRPQAVAEIATADVAVILAEEGDWWIGRKAFEYLRFAHTILAIVVPGDTTDLLSRHPRAVFVAPSEVFRLPRILESQYQEWRAGNWPRGPVPDAIQTDETCVAGVARVLHAALNGLDYPSKI